MNQRLFNKFCVLVTLIFLVCIAFTPVTACGINTEKSNIVFFGDTTKVAENIKNKPCFNDYSSLGYQSGIRREGWLEAFSTNAAISNDDWAQVTNGAAINTAGNLSAIPFNSIYRQKGKIGTPGRKYVAISQYDGWLLAIYEDKEGLTHLEAIDNPIELPQIVKYLVPKGTGWKKIAAGKYHALALRSDGTLVAWGDNTYGQLDLPSNLIYTDIAAGEDFSIGLSISDTNPVAGHGGNVHAAGKNSYNVVSDMNCLPEGEYIAIEAGPSFRAAALTHDGRILLKGNPLPGDSPLPTDAGYTDISLGPDYGFALREMAKEVTVTEPLSPGNSVIAGDGSELLIPYGSLFEHTHNEVTRVFAPDGTQILWANDDESKQVRFPAGAELPVSLIHYVPSGSTVDGTEPYMVTVTRTHAAGGTADVMTVYEDAWYDESDPSRKPTLPRAMCFADTGCSAGTAAKQQLFLSDPRKISGSAIPVFSVHQLANNSWVGTLSTLGSTNAADSTSIIMEKNRVDPNQPINFSIISGNWSHTPGVNMFMTAKANLTNTSSALQYTITGTSSRVLREMNITPQIWQKRGAGDVLVFTGAPVKCSNTKTCVATGNFTPLTDATYYANATVLYTVPTTVNGVVGTQGYAARVVSAGASGTGGYSVFAEAIDDYHGTQPPLHGSVDNAKGFYSKIKSASSEWSGLGENYDDNAMEKHWNKDKQAGTYANKADFSYFSGHGWNDRVVFGVAKDNLDLYRTSMSFGSTTKWVVLDACLALNHTTWTNWKPVFNGLHSLMGFDSEGLVEKNRGSDFAARMTADGYSPSRSITQAWQEAVKHSINHDNYSGAYMYIESCKNEKLPGWGTACTPTKNQDGSYTILYVQFDAKETRSE
ncbi:MAG: DUF6345 domain-containing protein [Methanoregula sp.]|nr:DUF6345 domain-containing protein [Methanoregula sp.]